MNVKPVCLHGAPDGCSLVIHTGAEIKLARAAFREAPCLVPKTAVGTRLTYARGTGSGSSLFVPAVDAGGAAPPQDFGVGTLAFWSWN